VTLETRPRDVLTASQEDVMPTVIPIRIRKSKDLFPIFVLILAAAFFVVELVDPAPTAVEAAALVSP
jgi:hypothetical protein